jgi:hypothetical protein
MSWAGGLAMGMGGSLGGGLDKVPPRAARNVREAMRQAAEAMANGTAVSAEAARLLAEPLMPRWLYLLAGNAGWRWQLRQNRAKRPIAFRPYPQD